MLFLLSGSRKESSSSVLLPSVTMDFLSLIIFSNFFQKRRFFGICVAYSSGTLIMNPERMKCEVNHGGI